MIAVHLSGGLGNQMFQYAFGKYLSERFKTNLVLDARSFSEKPGSNFDDNGVAVRNYELSCFNLQSNFMDEQAKNFFFPAPSFSSRVMNKIARIFGTKKLVYEKKYGYDAGVPAEVGRNTYLHGYWQSHKYFEPVAETIRRDFSFVMPSERLIELENKIKHTNSVAIHVRRGDYVSSAAVNDVHGLMPFGYYQRAIELMTTKKENTSWFVFSDDINWCASAFSFLKEATFVSGQLQSPPYYEMYLMSLCKNHIIANSSFSWWGAWLSQEAGKIVIMPSQWFAKITTQELSLNPDHWILL